MLLVPNKIKSFILKTDIFLKVWSVVLRQYNYNKELKVYSYLLKAFNSVKKKLSNIQLRVTNNCPSS